MWQAMLRSAVEAGDAAALQSLLNDLSWMPSRAQGTFGWVCALPRLFDCIFDCVF